MGRKNYELPTTYYALFMKRNLISLFFLALVILALERVGLLRGLTSVGQPLQLAFYATTQNLKESFSTIFEIGSLREKNSQLSETTAFLEAENGRLKKLEEENKLLRDQLGIKQPEGVTLTQASVLGYSLATSRGFINLDKGEKAGIKVGDLALLAEIVLGKVSSVGPNSAQIQLLSDPESKILGETEAKAKGVVVGDFGSRMKLTKVLLDDDLQPGELVFTSGEEGMPKGLVVGKISKVKRLEAELFQEAEIEPLVDLNKLEIVFLRSL